MAERTSEYNEQTEGTFGNRAAEKEVGPNCTLELPSGETPVSNVSFTEEAETSEVQYNDSFGQSIAVTGVTYSGSFDIPGNANAERDVGWDAGNNSGNTTLPRHVESMSIVDGEGRAYTFTNVLINSHSKDIPADDRTESSFDFMAERMYTEQA